MSQTSDRDGEGPEDAYAGQRLSDQAQGDAEKDGEPLSRRRQRGGKKGFSKLMQSEEGLADPRAADGGRHAVRRSRTRQRSRQAISDGDDELTADVLS
jgi:hypothetical protein